MSGTELVKVDNELAQVDDRQRALAELNDAAEEASSLYEAREVMVRGKAISEVFKQIRAPFEDSRLAGKASVVAARKLGRLLEELDPAPTPSESFGPGFSPSERGLAVRELRITRNAANNFIRLAHVEDPEFQRYIQRTDVIPSVHGALLELGQRHLTQRTPTDDWRKARRRRARVRKPLSPSLDEGYSLIVKALGHLTAKPVSGGTQHKKRDLAAAIDHLYAAEDLLKPYLGGYVGSKVA